MRTDHHDPGDVGEVGLECRQVLGELLVDDQDLRLGVVDDVGHLRGSQPPVHRNGHPIHVGRSEDHLEELDRVLVDEGHPVLGTDTIGDQGVGHLSGPTLHLVPRHAIVTDGDHVTVPEGSSPEVDHIYVVLNE